MSGYTPPASQEEPSGSDDRGERPYQFAENSAPTAISVDANGNETIKPPQGTSRLGRKPKKKTIEKPIVSEASVETSEDLLVSEFEQEETEPSSAADEMAFWENDVAEEVAAQRPDHIEGVHRQPLKPQYVGNLSRIINKENGIPEDEDNFLSAAPGSGKRGKPKQPSPIPNEFLLDVLREATELDGLEAGEEFAAGFLRARCTVSDLETKLADGKTGTVTREGIIQGHLLDFSLFAGKETPFSYISMPLNNFKKYDMSGPDNQSHAVIITTGQQKKRLAIYVPDALLQTIKDGKEPTIPPAIQATLIEGACFAGSGSSST